jgi:catechol 2,3-dioxygenase-like lactoylglutathione lyase family enzyme
LLRATRVDHVALAVGDIDKALVFYRSLFGNDVLKDSGTPRRYLRLGPCYMAIAPARRERPNGSIMLASECQLQCVRSEGVSRRGGIEGARVGPGGFSSKIRMA